jgi:hypothetical protein
VPSGGSVTRSVALVWWSLAGCAQQATVAELAPPHVELDRLDGRRPLPLLPRMALHQKEQMRSHLVAVEGVVAALAVDDWAGVEVAAAQLGSSPEMAQTCSHLGAAADGFTDQALAFHETADRVVQAARAQDTAAVLRATSETLQACTGCHATWRQQVVHEAEYGSLSGGAVGGHPR